MASIGHKFCMHGVLMAALALLAAPGVHAGEWDLSAILDLEAGIFPHAPANPRQSEATLSPSFSFEPKAVYEWNNGNDRFSFKPFARLDWDDSRRSHVDLREASWLHLGDSWDTIVGVDKVFWGVTESRHLVDIINQTDAVENIDGEDKLGQPMLNFNLERDWGTASLYLLTGFRERTFAGAEGRFAGPLAIDHDGGTYEAGAAERHVDIAVRWRQTFGELDLGLAYFRGTSREPRLIPTPRNGVTFLVPRYDLISQLGLDTQLTRDATLWKLEAISRTGHGSRFYAAVAGVEHTLYGIAGTRADLGLLTEYQYDGRNPATAPVANEDRDIFVGARLTLNDEQDTAMLAGAVVDRTTRSTILSFEAERRLNDGAKLTVEVRIFTHIDARDTLAGIKNDDVLIARLSTYF